MTDSLAALGVVANLLRLIESCGRIVTTAHEMQLEVFKNGGVVELLLKDWTTAMQHYEQNSSPLIPLVPELAPSISTCNELASDLAEILQGLKKNEGEDSSKWRRVKALLPTHHPKPSKIKEIDARFITLRGQIVDHLQEKKILGSVAWYTNMGSFTDMDWTDHVWNLNEAVRKREWDGKSPNESHLWNQSGSVHFNKLVQDLEHRFSMFSREIHYNKLLESIYFSGMKERADKIPNANPTSFDWILGDNPTANLLQWMASKEDDGIYCITGNAGSGKSTLMKSILQQYHDDDSCFSGACLALDTWSEYSQVASHFFWGAGTPMQRSKEGLLRSLLFQIIKTDGLLEDACCPEYRTKEDPFGTPEPWTVDELVDAFKKFSTLDEEDSEICFFIDGLDEHDGDVRELMHLLCEISRAPRIKICVSSRPLTEVQEVLGGSQWTLTLPDNQVETSSSV